MFCNFINNNVLIYSSSWFFAISLNFNKTSEDSTVFLSNFNVICFKAQRFSTFILNYFFFCYSLKVLFCKNLWLRRTNTIFMLIFSFKQKLMMVYKTWLVIHLSRLHKNAGVSLCKCKLGKLCRSLRKSYLPLILLYVTYSLSRWDIWNFKSNVAFFAFDRIKPMAEDDVTTRYGLYNFILLIVLTEMALQVLSHQRVNC